MKVRWIIFAFVIVVVGFAIQTRLKVRRDEALVLSQIDKMNAEPKVAPLITPPPLKRVDGQPAGVDAPKVPAVTLKDLKQIRDSFMRRHKLSYDFSPDVTSVFSASKEAESLMQTQTRGLYTYWFTVFPGPVPQAKIVEQVAKNFKLASDDYKQIETPVTRYFVVDGAYEFEIGAATFVYVIMRHPSTKKSVLVMFSSRKFNLTVEKIANHIFENLKSTQ